MLEKPAIPDERIVTRLQEAFGLAASQLTFLPLGADVNTAVYRVVSQAGPVYFLKLRRGAFDEITLDVPRLLRQRGIQAIIAPLETSAGRAWAELDEYGMALYPFIAGRNGYEVPMTGPQWLAFGEALRAIHAVQAPPDLARRIPREQYPAQGRDSARRFLAQAESGPFVDPVAAEMAAFMRAHRAEINRLVDRAGQLAAALREQPLDFVLCHADIHPGNLLLPTDPASAGKRLYIVDWDNPIFAPKEHDLSLIGGTHAWDDRGQNALFYHGYLGERSPATINRLALAYYRYERIVQDIAAFGEAILATPAGGADRPQQLLWFTGQFAPHQEVELAFEADPSI